ncbi:hypothetical protein TWF730_006815 [Orbilia blumenaviensis]|uniref:Up-regulated during septation protein 1 domain-containing protein n=1 Tax=Orbilia blumenaviensis TaxID=1796055 RepID=A0AAV9VIU4_9PEZI
MPWPWNRPKSPFGFSDSEDTTSSGSTTATSTTTQGTSILSTSLNEVVSSNTGNSNGAGRNGISMTNRNVAATAVTGGRQITTTASRATTPTPALNARAQSFSFSSSSSASGNGNGNGNVRAASSLGHNHDVPQNRSQSTRRNSRDTSVINPNPGSIRRTASMIPEDHTVQLQNGIDKSPPSSSSGTPSQRPIRRPSSSRGSEFRNTSSPENILSNPQPSVESLSSAASSSLHSDINNHTSYHHHGKRSLSAGSNSQLNIFHGPISPSFSNGRAFSPTPSVGSMTHQTSITRSQKAIIPPGSRQSNTSEEQVFIYELPESYEQVNGLNSHEIEERDLRHKAVVELNPVAGIGIGIGGNAGQSRPRSNFQSREMMLEAEVARLRKLCEKYKRSSVNNTSSSSVGSIDHLIIPDIAAAAAGSSEAHRVVKVMKVANEHLQKKIDARDALLADRLAELEQIQNRHAIELEQQKQGYQVQMRQLADRHRVDMEANAQRNVEEVVALKRNIMENAVVFEGQRRDAERIAVLQAEIEGFKALDKVKSDGHSAALEEIKLKAAEDLEAAKKKFEEAEEMWEIKTEEMRRELFEEKKPADCTCSSKASTATIEELKREHDTEISALKTSIRILEGSRGTTIEQLEEDQRVYRKVSELETSLAAKVRALAAERKTSERLRASLSAVEAAKSEIQLQKEAAETKLLEASTASDSVTKEGRQAVEESIRRETQKELAALKQEYESALEIERARVQELSKQREVDTKVFDDRVAELNNSVAHEKEQLSAAHAQALSSLKDSIKTQANAEISSLKEELEVRARSLGELEAELVITKNSIDEALKQQQTASEKEKEALIAEYQVVINAGDRLRDQEKTAFQSDKQHLERLLTEAKAQHEEFKAKSNATLEQNFKSATTEFETRLLEVQREHLIEKQALCKAVEEAKAQWAVQQSALELRLQTQLQEAEQQFFLRRESERRIEAAKFEEAKAEIEKTRDQHNEEIRRLETENKETKDRAARVVAELQQQLKEDEENKQQLLDRVAKAESEKDNADAELAGLKVRFEESDNAAKKAEAQVLSSTEEMRALKAKIEDERKTANDSIAELRSQLQTRERLVNELHAKHQQDIEGLQFQLRTAQTKLDIDSVEIESLKEAIRERELTFNTLRDEKNSTGSLWVEEKQNLATKHTQIIEGHLNTIAKLEDSLNKMRARTTEEAKAAEIKAAEQQGLVAQWISNSNRRTDEAQRLERALKEANGMTDSFKLDIRALKNDLKQYEKESRDQKAEIKSLVKELKLSREENVSLKSQMESSSGSSYRHARQISDLESKIQALAREIQESRTEISAQKRTAAKRDSTIKQLEDALQQRSVIRNGRASPSPSAALQMAVGDGTAPSTPSVSSLQRDLRDSRAEVTRLNEKLEMYETEYRHFFEDYEKLKVEHEEGQKSMKAKLDAYVPELEHLRKGKRDLELRLQSAELRLAASGGLVRRGLNDGEGPTMRSQSSMSYLRHGEISVGSLDA